MIRASSRRSASTARSTSTTARERSTASRASTTPACSPITDTTPAINYTFNDFGYPDQSFSATTGPIDRRLPDPRVRQHADATAAELRDDRHRQQELRRPSTRRPDPGVPGTASSARSTSRLPPTGCSSLTFNTPTGGDNNVSFVNTPPGVVTSLNGGADEDVTNVTGLGVADGTVLFLNGGAGTNTLNYDAGGEIPTITPGLLPGEVLITHPRRGHRRRDQLPDTSTSPTSARW